MKRKVLLLLMAFFMIGAGANASAQVSITGIGATGGWGDGFDADMSSSDGVHWTLPGMIMAGGDFKFRLDHMWTTAWGNSTGTAIWPAGIAVIANGGDNIVCPAAGQYDVIFNSDTGEFQFIGGAPIPVVYLFGNAVNAGPEGLQMLTNDGTIYTLSNVTLLDGTAQFNLDGSVFGGPDFPSGTVVDETISIPVTAGTYNSISFNSGDGTYNFVAAPVYPVISIIGSGTTGTNAGWNNDFADLTTTDGITYTAKDLTLYSVNSESPDPGAVKFRKNHDWNPVSYGGLTFPSGPQAGNEGDNILVSDGLWNVTFDLPTGAYTFSLPAVSLVGPAVGGWPGDPGNPGPIDLVQLTSTDGENYSINNLDIVDGEAKFRLNNDWGTSWGDPITGGNIVLTAGNYNVTFTRSTGVYTFTNTLATKSFDATAFNAYPNPTHNNWNFTAANESITSIQVVDMLGKTVLSVTPNNTTASVDARSLNTGIYFAKISTANGSKTVKLVKN